MECGCASVCDPGKNMEEVTTNCEVCAPVCVCPEGYYELKGECVSGVDCMETEPQEEQHKVVDTFGSVCKLDWWLGFGNIVAV